MFQKDQKTEFKLTNLLEDTIFGFLEFINKYAYTTFLILVKPKKIIYNKSILCKPGAYLTSSMFVGFIAIKSLNQIFSSDEIVNLEKDLTFFKLVGLTFPAVLFIWLLAKFIDRFFSNGINKSKQVIHILFYSSGFQLSVIFIGIFISNLHQEIMMFDKGVRTVPHWEIVTENILTLVWSALIIINPILYLKANWRREFPNLKKIKRLLLNIVIPTTSFVTAIIPFLLLYGLTYGPTQIKTELNDSPDLRSATIDFSVNDSTMKLNLFITNRGNAKIAVIISKSSLNKLNSSFLESENGDTWSGQVFSFDTDKSGISITDSEGGQAPITYIEPAGNMWISINITSSEIGTRLNEFREFQKLHDLTRLDWDGEIILFILRKSPLRPYYHEEEVVVQIDINDMVK
ncbi:hypothetical protein [Aquimarina sp. AU58]|uniref:hypothetical protein n=1 Tax=Aquimarina sp. AU58 TaxID=1874112 RepID=UPI000D6EA8A5|nr:hypothetical protein [Aquimarina sp. AU58]